MVKKIRWSNEPRPFTVKQLKRVHWFRKNNISYREIAKLMDRDHATTRKYYLRWRNNLWYIKLLDFLIRWWN